jgi:hypothetical protein
MDNLAARLFLRGHMEVMEKDTMCCYYNLSSYNKGEVLGATKI